MTNSRKPNQQKAQPPKDRSRGKIIFAGFLFAVALVFLWGRAYQVQIVKGPEYTKMANRQYWASETIAGKRGEIVDRNGLLLAKSVVTQSVYVRPYELADPRGAAQQLGKILGVPSSNVLNLLKSKKRFVWVARKISDAQARAVCEAALPGIYLDAESSRQYPQGYLAGQLLGFVNVDGQGIEGVEKSFNEALAPSSVKYTVQRDASGKRLSFMDRESQSSLDGKKIQLTIDSQVQLATEVALQRMVAKARGKHGMALVVEIPSGDILAWGNYPFFNPNSGRRDRGVGKNRVAMDIFEPGSTMKPFVIAAALQENVCQPSTEYFCENGKWQVKGRRIKDTHNYGKLPVNKILRYSSNIGAAKIGLALGAPKYEHYLRELGFGRPLGLPLPGESVGMLRPAKQWHQVDLANIAFGQGLGVTMPQLAEGYFCLANGGVRVPLRLVVNKEAEPAKGKRVFGTHVAKAVMSMLEEVVQEDGTGRNARIEGVRVAGKTGTAQKASAAGGYGEEFVASFVSIFPADKPRYLIRMMVDEPQAGHYGGTIVAPEVRNISVQLLTASGMLSEPEIQVARSEAADPESGDPRLEEHIVTPPSTERYTAPVRRPVKLSAEEMRTMPDLQGTTVRQALEVLLTRGVVPTINGQGALIVRQKPSPGEAWPADKTCQLWLSRQPG